MATTTVKGSQEHKISGTPSDILVEVMIIKGTMIMKLKLKLKLFKGLKVYNFTLQECNSVYPFTCKKEEVIPHL